MAMPSRPWLLIKHGLPLNPFDEQQYEKFWAQGHFIGQARGPAAEEVKKALMDHIYGLLNILDGKAGSLIQFNAIGITSILIFVSSKLTDVNESEAFVADYPMVLATVSLMSAVLSSVLCHFVIPVYWADVRDLRMPGEWSKGLFRRWRNRTIHYRRAWWYSMLAVLVVPVALIGEFGLRIGLPFEFSSIESALVCTLGLCGIVVLPLHMWDDLVLLFWSSRQK